ncbi:MAG: hypothetical protein ACI9O6_001144 [Glaciecola sp.]|jgi:hypothetical protein
MKTKFYIGLVGDETQESSLVGKDGDTFKVFLNVLLEHAKAKCIDTLPFEPVLLTNASTKSERDLCEQARHFNISVEIVPIEIYQNQTSLSASSNDDWYSFLINKSNLLLIVQSQDKKTKLDTTLSSHAIVQRVLHPEKDLNEELTYFATNSEFLPYLFQLNVSGADKNTQGFVRENELESFAAFMENIRNISSEINATKKAHLDQELAEALNTQATEKYSLSEFYQLSCKFDSLASKNQRKSNIGFWILFSLTLVLGASFLLYAKVFTNSPWLLIIYLIAYTSGVLTFYQMNKKAALKKHLAYRLCAEVLRLKLFQLVSFTGNKVDAFQFEKMLSLSNMRTDWIAHIVRSLPLHQIEDNSTLNDRKSIIMKHLVDDQLNYFNVKLKGRNKKNGAFAHKSKLDGIEKWLHRFSLTSMFIVVFCVALMIIVTLTAFKVGVFYELYPIKNIMMFVIGFLPLVGLAFEQLIFNFALEENEMRYHHQISKFRAMKQWMSAANTESTLIKITNQLCIECAQENFNWYTTRVNRQHKPASGG